jgi:hypothetical protein
MGSGPNKASLGQIGIDHDLGRTGGFLPHPKMFCSDREVTQTPGYLSHATLFPVRARSDYIESAAHYECVARRIVVALRSSDRSLVLVTGDPAPDPEGISEALSKVMGPGYTTIIIPCRPELSSADLERAILPQATPKADCGGKPEARSLMPPSRVLLFDQFDQLSDTQIKIIFETHDQIQRAAILVALPDFLDRLERPALGFLKDRIAGQFRFHEIGDDEAIGFLHNQLLSQADRRVEARGFRRGISVGLAFGGVALAASIAAFALHPIRERIPEPPANISQERLVDPEASMIRPTEEAAASAAPTPAAPVVESYPVIVAAPSAPSALSPPSSPGKMEDPPPMTETSGNEPAVPRLSGSEITVLLRRGDALLGMGDITSARLFYEHIYERAADAESGLAALRLGATFDPLFAGRADARAAVDPAQALVWYRRARKLGVGEAEQRIERLDPGSVGEKDMLSRK